MMLIDKFEHIVVSKINTFTPDTFSTKYFNWIKYFQKPLLCTLLCLFHQRGDDNLKKNVNLTIKFLTFRRRILR